MFNTLFSALENTRSSISKAFNKLKSGSMSQEEIENIEEKLLLADIGYDIVESIIEIIKKIKAGDFLFDLAFENKNWNYLGIEIREKLVDNAKF